MKNYENDIRASLQNVPTAPPAVNERLASAYAAFVRKPHRSWKTTIILSLAAATMLCGFGVYAAGTEGEFREIKNQFGAVTGGEYLNATSEIHVTAEPDAQGITVSVTFAKPDAAPYYTFEQIQLTGYEVIRLRDGAVITDNKAPTAPSAETLSSPMLLYIPVDETLESGAYELRISTFEGASKADQPLPIAGNWTIAFEVA